MMSQRSTVQEKKAETSRDDEQQFTRMRQRSIEQELRRSAVMGVSIVLQADHVGLLKVSQYDQHFEVSMAIFTMLAFYIYLCSRMLTSLWSRFAGIENYIISASVVITAYGKLIRINTSYTSIIVVPIVILFFIAALWNKFWFNSVGLKKSAGAANNNVGVSKKVEELLVITALPYCALYLEALFGDSLAVSHFLWFLSSSLGAVAVMIALLPVAASPAGAQVLQLLYKTCVIALAITVHTKAAELVREDMALVCMPELVTVLVWFTIRFRLGVPGLRKYVGLGISRKIIVVVAFLVLGYHTVSPAYEYQERSRALRACSCSACLSCFSMFMLRWWPGNSKPAVSSQQVPVKLLEFFSISAAAVLAVMSAKCGHYLASWIASGGQAILSIVYLVYVKRRLEECAGKTSPPVPREKHKTQ
ncbi:hypothetical protein BS78_03G147700 [Paspalum vaginatum]|nr:hypothetical protein BS78_03G147700 [Paspalum vaginatum]